MINPEESTRRSPAKRHQGETTIVVRDEVERETVRAAVLEDLDGQLAVGTELQPTAGPWLAPSLGPSLLFWDPLPYPGQHVAGPEWLRMTFDPDQWIAGVPIVAVRGPPRAHDVPGPSLGFTRVIGWACLS